MYNYRNAVKVAEDIDGFKRKTKKWDNFQTQEVLFGSLMSSLSLFKDLIKEGAEEEARIFLLSLFDDILGASLIGISQKLNENEVDFEQGGDS